MRISDWSSDVCSSDLVAVWAAQPARRAAFWEADRSRCSCKPPENGNASIAKVTPAGHKTSLGSQHLALAAVVTKLAHCLDHVVESPALRLNEQAAMGVDRTAATQPNWSDERCAGKERVRTGRSGR